MQTAVCAHDAPAHKARAALLQRLKPFKLALRPQCFGMTNDTWLQLRKNLCSQKVCSESYAVHA